MNHEGKKKGSEQDLGISEDDNEVKETQDLFSHIKNKTNSLSSDNDLFKTKKLNLEKNEKTYNITTDNDFIAVKKLMGNLHKEDKTYNINTDDDFVASNKQQLKARDEIYTNLLKDFYGIYVERQEQKEIHKWDFYSFTMKGSAWVIGVLLIVMFSLSIKIDKSNVGALIPPLIVSIVSLISTLIAIPTIISKYLFNPNEDKEVVNMIASIQEKDLQNRGNYK